MDGVVRPNASMIRIAGETPWVMGITVKAPVNIVIACAMRPSTTKGMSIGTIVQPLLAARRLMTE